MKSSLNSTKLHLPAQMLCTSDLAHTRKRNRGRPPIFNISEPTIWQWVKSGILPKPIQVGGRSFWSASDIIELIESQNGGDKDK